MKNKIYTTVGVYRNQDYKVNGVEIDRLPAHVAYNLDYRPGRALFVNGICIYHGSLSVDEVLEWEKKITEDRETFWRDEDTQPYV